MEEELKYEMDNMLLSRYNKTIKLVERFINTEETILDLGIKNPLSNILIDNGYNVTNTSGEDLDFNTDKVAISKFDVVTAFEILEHLVAPLNVLKALKAKKLIATVPLNLWFAKAYKSSTDPWDKHYHEFEDWQFDMLLNKAGWNIIHSEKWIVKTKLNGFRPILRSFTPRIYAVVCEKI